MAVKGGIAPDRFLKNIFTETVENPARSGIIEERYNDGSHYTKDEHGRFTGSTSTGGGSGGSSSGGGSSESSSSGENNSNKQRLQKMIENGDVTLKINETIQNRHYKGTKEYNDFLRDGVEKSYFTVPQTELQKILNEKNTTGSIRIDRAGVAREIFDCGKPVAYDTQLKVNTSFVKVHYSKKKTHLSPHTPDRRNE